MSGLLQSAGGHGAWVAAMMMFMRSSVILAAGLVAARVLARRGPATRSAILRATLVTAILSLAVSAALDYVRAPGLYLASRPFPPSSTTVEPASVERAVTQTIARAQPPEGPRPRTPDLGRQSGVSTVGAPIAPSTPQAPPAKSTQPIARSIDLERATVWIFAAISALLLARLAVANVLIARTRLRSRRASEAVIDSCHRIAERMGTRAPEILVAGELDAPRLAGWLRPVILLPESDQNPESEILVHELAHVRRADCAWQFLARVAASIIWYQPLAWVLAWEMERTAEEACDDWVLHYGGNRTAYAGRLLRLAECAQSRWVSPAGVGVVGMRSSVGKRVVRLLDPANSPIVQIGKRTIRSAVLAAVLLSAGSAVLRTGYAKATVQEAPKPATKILAHGRVVDATGKPVAGADVYLVKGTSAAPDVIESTRSDSRGDFELHQAPTSTPPTSPYEVQAHLPGQGVGAERYDTTKDCQVTLRPSTRITLTILDPDAKPIAGMKVYPLDFVSVPLVIQGSPRGSFFFMNLPLTLSHQLEGVTDTQGRITLADVPQGAKLRIGFDDERFAYPGPTKRVGVSDHDAISPPATVQLDRGAIATGTVRYGPTGKPAAGIGVTFQATNRNFSASGGSGRTGDDGTFRIAHLSAGEFNAMLRLDEDLEKDWNAAAHEWVKIQPGQTLTDLNFSLIKGGIVTGRVTMADSGKPITETRVAAHGPARPRSSAAVQGTLVGSDGSYSLRVPPGLQYVYVQGPVPEAYRQDKQDIREVQVEDGQTVTLDFKLPRQAGEGVAGVVIGLDGKPAANIPVRALTGGIANDGFTSTSTDARGHFHFDALAPSTPLSVQSGDLGTADPVYVQKGQGEVKLQLIRRVKLTLTGVITDEQGKPVPNARIRLSQQMGRFGRGEHDPRIAGPDGRYEIKDLYTDNQYSIAADADGFGEAQARLHLDAGTKELPTLKLPRADSTTGGVVVDAEGKPVAGITMHLNNGLSPKTAITDAQGQFSFPVVAGKSHLIWIAVKERGKVGPNANGVGGRTDLKLVLPKEEQ